jgi:iron(III) transport system substrate-binding protein
MPRTPVKLLAGGVCALALAPAVATADPPRAADTRSAHQAPGGTLTIFTGRKESLIAPALSAFRAETGINFVVKSGTTGGLASEIIAQRNNPQASVLFSQDAPTCEALRRAGVLEANDSAALKAIPPRFRASDGSWVGISGRARVLMYNRDLVKPADLPRSVLDLAKPRWRGKVATPSSREASVVSWAGALIRQMGREAAERYLRRLAANDLAVLGSHTDVRRAVARGEFAIGMVNHYYYHLTRAEGGNVGIVHPDQGRLVRKRTFVGSGADRRAVVRTVRVPRRPLGVLFNAASLCLVKDGPAQREARALIDYMTSARAQVLFSELNYEYPLRSGLAATNGVRNLKTLYQAPVALKGINSTAGLEILRAAGIN